MAVWSPYKGTQIPATNVIGGQRFKDGIRGYVRLPTEGIRAVRIVLHEIASKLLLLALDIPTQTRSSAAVRAPLSSQIYHRPPRVTFPNPETYYTCL